MIRSHFVLSVLFVLFSANELCLAQGRWEMQFFHDETKSTMVFHDIAFCSAERGVASATLLKRDGNSQPVVLTTRDGGANWTTNEVKEAGSSLFFLDEAAGWMVAESGIWFTDEAGANWRRLYKERGLTEVYFLNRERGFAIGTKRRLLETKDGGRTWAPAKISGELNTSEDRTTLFAIAFARGRLGLVAGRSVPPSDERVPIWMDPKAKSRRELPALSVLLQTVNGGDSWKPDTISLFGRLTKLVLPEKGRGLLLTQFDRFFEYPSELTWLNVDTQKSEPALRRSDLAITDIGKPSAGGSALAAGYVPAGLLAKTPVPGRVVVMQTENERDWKEMPVDYRAVATDVALTIWDRDRAWLATDTGMILRWVPGTEKPGPRSAKVK